MNEKICSSCGYCNPGEKSTCVRCGAELDRERAARKRGYIWVMAGVAVAAVLGVAILLLRPGFGAKNTDCIHVWRPSDCLAVRTCPDCGETLGTEAGHSWSVDPSGLFRTCSVCATTEEIIAEEPVYLNDMDYVDKVGKLWTRSEEPVSYPAHPDAKDVSVWAQEDIPGHSVGKVFDNQGNLYRYGLHLDGKETKEYYITYDLGGQYRFFTGWCGFPGTPLSKYADKSSKYFEIYADGELVYVTRKMDFESLPEYIEVDVTGVKTLTIRYPESKQVNEAATLFDGMLS